MSDADLTAAYYGLSGTTQSLSVEVPVKGSDEVVTVDFVADLPEAEDITSFLENEEADLKYWFSCASCYTLRGMPDQSMEVVNTALKYFYNMDRNELPKVHTFLAWLAINKARNAPTEEDRKTALFSASESLKLGDQEPLAALASAEVLYLEKRDAEAIRALDLVKGREDGDVLPSYAQLTKAKIFFRRGKINEALRLFQAVLVEQPLLKPDPRLGIGLCFWALKDRKLAVQSWKRSLQLDPENLTSQTLIALSKFDTAFNSLSDEEFAEKYVDALDNISAIIRKTSTSSTALLMEASFHFSCNEYDIVKSICEKITSQDLNSTVVRSDAHFWLGRVAYAQQQFVEAQTHFKTAMDLNPSSHIAQLGYAQAQASRGDLQDAIFSLNAVIEKHPKSTEAHYALGMLHTERFETTGESEDSQKAVSSLLEYIKLSQQKNEPVAVSAYLALSHFHETSNTIEALKYLNKAVEAFTAHGEQAPAELMSNMGVLHFVQGSQESAKTLFETAIAANDNEETAITLSYNLARSEENSDEDASLEKYQRILEKASGYVSAKMRSLFLQIVKSGNTPELETEIDTLLSEQESNLEVRAFYSWYLKKTGRGLADGLENTHNKETLTKYDSRDTYALISLANMYRTIAREIRPKSEQETQKRKTSYHRAAQLFHKAIVTDPKNAFAAQGIAIVFAEEKQPAQALEIFRRVRDAVDSFSVHLNLGHCLCELGQHAKAIQEYSIALARFSDENRDARTLSLIGRAWFARGGQEKSLESYAKALEFSINALKVAEEYYQKLVPQMQYNVAFVQFSIAQFLTRLEISKRTVEDISNSLSGLNEAVETFTKLAELGKQAPVAPEILTQRATMGSKTLTTQLERILKEQEQYEVQFQAKIEEAKRVREVERARAELEEKKRKEEQEEKEKKLREEFDMLQEQAKQWEAERASLIIVEDEKPKGRKKKNAIWTDEEASGDEGNVEKKPKSKKKRTKKKAQDGEGDDDEEKPVKTKKRRLTKREGKYKSKEIIEDSDEDLADFDEDALEKAEAKIDGAGENEEEEEAVAEENVDEDEDMEE
ncbi:CYFA0S05e00232g1_1 [Cyberlindnera fabianii]|uniref:CYFA0S05e00232g1_1 n=1 Tax=Cyberlindnera fabianii TaxID=36022 RepID=A0A061AYC4_CYBFA|nr:RNA polymerase-associated protein CTR9 [Cyberlindnera fabianii]CDR40389.1 CYFA0S05e00232g1_1 [Cyberlindnera fabianii]